MEGVSVSLSRLMFAVPGIAPEARPSANLWTFLSFCVFIAFLIALIQMTLLYDSIGRIVALYIQRQVLGVRPHVGPTALLHCMRFAVAFLVMFVMC